MSSIKQCFSIVRVRVFVYSLYLFQYHQGMRLLHVGLIHINFELFAISIFFFLNNPTNLLADHLSHTLVISSDSTSNDSIVLVVVFNNKKRYPPYELLLLVAFMLRQLLHPILRTFTSSFDEKISCVLVCLALTNSAYLYKRPKLLLILLKNGVRKKNDHWNNTMYLYSLHMGIPTLEQATSSYTHTAFTRSVTHSFLLPHTFFSFISVHKHTHTHEHRLIRLQTNTNALKAMFSVSVFSRQL